MPSDNINFRPEEQIERNEKFIETFIEDSPIRNTNQFSQFQEKQEDRNKTVFDNNPFPSLRNSPQPETNEFEQSRLSYSSQEEEFKNPEEAKTPNKRNNKEVQKRKNKDLVVTQPKSIFVMPPPAQSRVSVAEDQPDDYNQQRNNQTTSVTRIKSDIYYKKVIRQTRDFEKELYVNMVNQKKKSGHIDKRMDPSQIPTNTYLDLCKELFANQYGTDLEGDNLFQYAVIIRSQFVKNYKLQVNKYQQDNEIESLRMAKAMQSYFKNNINMVQTKQFFNSDVIKTIWRVKGNLIIQNTNEFYENNPTFSGQKFEKKINEWVA